MSTLVDAGLLKEIKAYGSFDISACFNCGNCTAVCPLSEEGNSFPRQMIRRGQLGFRQELLSRHDMWLCYYCGECSATCPRQAFPGEYMAALRRWAIAQYEPLGLGKLALKGAWPLAMISLLAGLVLALLLVTAKSGGQYPAWIFPMVPYEGIHLVGLGLGGLLALSLAASVFNFLRHAAKDAEKGWLSIFGKPVKQHWAALKALGLELATMRRHGSQGGAGQASPSAWSVHLLIMAGFGGLLAATSLDFLFLFLLRPWLHWEAFMPSRYLGTLAGLAMLAGISVASWRRWRGTLPASRHTHAPDAWLLAYLGVLGLTGFWRELAVAFRYAPPANQWVLLLHTVMAMELVLFLPFTKLAHAVYRPLALYLRSLSAPKSPQSCS